MQDASSAPPVCRSYLVCSVQRTGSALFCQMLRRTRLAGLPYELFRANQEARWARWHVSSWGEYFDAFRRETVTPNGVIGAKLMWKQLDEGVRHLRDEAGYVGYARDEEVLAAALPGLRYIWLRRENKVRQGISWWRAQTSQQFHARSPSDSISPAPKFDFDTIDGFVTQARHDEDAWRQWFAARDIEPFEVVYESFVQRREKTVREALRYLDIDIPVGFAFRRGRLTRQARLRPLADNSTEAIEAAYRAERAKREQ